MIAGTRLDAVTFLTPPLSDRCRSASRGARDPPSQGHGWSPAALHQMPRCTADSRASIVPGQFSFSPEVDAELPVVPGASTCDAAPATVAHIDQLRAASASMVAFYHKQGQANPGRATSSRRCELKVRIAFAATAQGVHASVGRYCEHVSPCCCLSSTWLIGPAHIASTVMRKPLVDRSGQCLTSLCHAFPVV